MRRREKGVLPLNEFLGVCDSFGETVGGSDIAGVGVWMCPTEITHSHRAAFEAVTK